MCICAVLGLLHYFDVAKPFEKITGIIGLSTGVITFVLTLVYICYSGYIFTKQVPSNDYDNGLSDYLKLDKEGAYAKKDGNQFKCLYYKNNKDNSGYAKFSDLGKRQYNYEKKRHYPEDNSKYTKCGVDPTNNFCVSEENINISPLLSAYSDCEYLYLNDIAEGFGNKYLFDMWVTTIIFTCFICVCAIGLAIFGFLLFNSSDGSGL